VRRDEFLTRSGRVIKGVVGLTRIARKTVVGCVERKKRFYEGGADVIRIGEYLPEFISRGNPSGLCSRLATGSSPHRPSQGDLAHA
jgi:hypothetical protein